MALATGSRVGACEVTGRLGAGGMGEVYRARNSRLGRDVAIQILPDGVTRDPDRVARFAREARVLATLDHPNIGLLYRLDRRRRRRERRTAATTSFGIRWTGRGDPEVLVETRRRTAPPCFTELPATLPTVR